MPPLALIRNPGEPSSEPRTLAGLLEELGRTDVGRLDDWLGRAAGTLRHFFPLDQATVGLLDSTGLTLTLAGAWSARPTLLKAGVRMRTSVTSIPELEALGRPAVFGEGGFRPATRTLEEILGADGVRSWVSIPLEPRGFVEGMLSFASATPGAFVEDDCALFDAIGRTCEALVLRLARQERRTLLSA
jgi:GAF domain